jgi:hypothetical protein
LTNKRLDREKQAEYRLVIEATDGKHVSSCDIFISVIDVNDNGPVFASLDYRVSIPEDVHPGTSVAHVMATDKDSGLNGEVYYTLGNSNSNFSIDPYTGIVLTMKSLIGAVGQSILTINAQDRQTGKDQMSATTLLTITVTKATPISPQIAVNFLHPLSTDIGSVHENATVGTLVATIFVMDSNTGMNVKSSLSVQSGNRDQTFRVKNAREGEFLLEVNHMIDREKVPKHTLQLIASDIGQTVQTASSIVTIQLLDVNDNTPQFERTLYRVTVDEAVLTGSQVIRLTATDKDEGSNAQLLYSIKSGNSLQWFHIDATSGQIQTAKSLNARQNGLFQLVVEAQDQGTIKLSTSATVFIEIADVNNHSPVFSQKHYSTTVKENVDIGIEVTHVTATDGDVGNNGSITYSILYNNPSQPDPFKINSTTGSVSVASSLDYESVHKFSLTVRAEDQGTPYMRYSDVKLTVHVLNENDNQPIFSPSLYSPLVSSQAAAGTVTILSARDNDLDNLTFTLSAGDRTKFHVTHGGIVATSVVLGKSSPSYLLVVSVSDGKYNSTAMVKVVVYDLALRQPVFQPLSNYSFTVSEAESTGYVVGHVLALSQDNLFVTYEIADGNQDGRFTINRTSGNVSLSRTLDYETLNFYLLTVTAVDVSGSVQRTGVALVSITVRNINDAEPVFHRNSKQKVTISQGKAVGSQVATVHATDADGDSLTYTLMGSTEVTSHFEMESSQSGVVITKKTFLDHDPPLQFPMVDIKASDGLHSTVFSFSVIVKDINNHQPKFSSLVVEFNVSEDAAVGHVIGLVSAHDTDLHFNSMLRYFISAGDTNSQFVINPVSGVLSLQSPLDYESNTLYSLSVTVGDMSDHQLTSTLIVIIKVLDANDLPPVFDSKSYMLSISEGTTVHTAILTVNATDPEGCAVKYEMGSDVRGYFEVDMTSGVIQIAKSLDREVTPEHQFYIRAIDCSPSLSSLVKIQVQLLDENDEPPVFLSSHYNLSVRQDLPVGAVAGTLYARDSDEGSNSVVNYRIRTGDTTTWRVDNVTGAIILQRSLKKNELFRLEIVALDVMPPHQMAVTVVEINVLKTNSNYNPPLFPAVIAVGAIHENVAVSTSVMTVSANDGDTNENGEIVYTIRGGSGIGLFAINEISGQVTVASEIDHEKSSYYSLLIHAHDKGLVPLTAETEIVIIVLDINDNAPVSGYGVTKGHVVSCAGSGQFVAAVYGSDMDSGNGANVTYAITSGNNLKRFTIDPNNGVVNSLSDIDLDGLPQYNLLVTLSDEGNVSLSSTAVVTVNVVDCSDQAPKFVGLPYVSQVLENRKEEYVIQVVARDDHPSNSISYSLNDAFGGLFSINSSTGVISCELLDYEAQSTYQLVVRASNKLNAVSTDVTIKVTDERDRPAFTNLPTIVYVQEISTTGNSVVMSVSAIDPDNAPYTSVVYSIMSADEEILSVFSIDSVSGDIIKNESLDLDYERRKQYDVFIQARYNNSHLFNWSYVTVIVVDNDDNLPVFDQTPVYYVMVKSLLVTNTTLVTLHATDLDTGINAAIEYAIAPANQQHFSIDASTGALQIKKALTGLSARLTVIARNPANHARHSKVDVVLSVVTASSLMPLFSSPKVVSLSLSEDLSVGNVVAKAIASSSGSRNIEYEIAGGNVDGVWNIEMRTGSVAIAKELLYERVSRYTLIVRAIIRETPPLTDEKTFIINVLPVNDHKPYFSHLNPITVDIAEDQPMGTFITRASAHDMDAGTNGQLKYSLTGDAAFSINSVTGVITATTSLDYETRSSYILYVQAQDQGIPVHMAAVELKIVVNVIDLLDDPPVFHKSTYSVTVQENSFTGTPLKKVTAMDRNGRVVHYSLTSPNSAPSFQVNPLTGAILLASELDRDSGNFHQVSVTASNGLTESHVLLSVHLHDVNDNSPEFTHSSYSLAVQENGPPGQQILSLTALDPDHGVNGTVTFSLVASSTPNLICASNGSVTVVNPFDREVSSNEYFIVAAADGGVPPLYGYASVTVTVTDDNDHMPIFTSDVYNASMNKNAAIGTTVAQVVATDLDVGSNGTVKYSFEAGNPVNMFAIDISSGSVTVKNSLKLADQALFLLTVKATDGGQPARSSTASLFIRIIDVANTYPQFSQSIYRANVDEENVAGTFVTQVAIKTIHRVVYSFVKADSAGNFSLNSQTGVVKTAIPLDHEGQDLFRLIVNATDIYNQYSTAEVLVTVNDLNDNAPRFAQEFYATTVPEDAPLGLEVIVLYAEDRDAGTNGEVRYRLVGSSVYFGLNQQTGNLTTTHQLTGMAGQSLHFVITAQDQGNPSFTAFQQAVVQITVIKPHHPVFEKSIYNVSILVPVDVSVVKVTATDIDVNETLTYSIISGDPFHFFAIDELTGEITVQEYKGLDEFYKLLISVSDRVHANYTVVLVYVSSLFEFSQPFYNLSVSEGTMVGEIILSLHLLAASRDVTFSLATPFTEFAMRQNSIFVAGSLDRETRPHYHLIVTGTSLHPFRTTSTQVNITVSDVNDNAPQFIGQKPFKAYFREGQPAGTLVYQLHAHDVDNGVNAETTFQSIGLYSGLPFSVLPGGQIIASQTLDSSMYSGYQVEIMCYDSGNPKLSSKVWVSLTKVGRSNTKPLFEHSSYKLNISENLPVGSTVTFIRATAVYGSSVDYLIRAGGEKFTINSNGALILSRSLDFESKQQHSLTVEASDATHTSDVTVTIDVLDANDNSPQFPAGDSLFLSVREDMPVGSSLQHVPASDADSGFNSLLFYMLENDHNGTFSIGSLSGDLYLNQSLDYEQVPQYVFNIWIRDTGQPPHFITVVSRITVININDETPYFEQENVELQVSDKTQKGSVICQVFAVDKDNLGPLWYMLDYGNIEGVFSIGRNTGALILEREKQKGYYQLNVSVTDTQFTAYSQVIIAIGDVNEHVPQFMSGTCKGEVDEGSPNGTYVKTLSVTDADLGTNGLVTFQTLGKPKLRVDQLTGEVFTNVMSRDLYKSGNCDPCVISAQVLATDGGGNTAYCQLDVTLKDINNNKPVFTTPVYLATIEDNRNIGSFILKVSADDADRGINSKVVYSVQDNFTLFTVQTDGSVLLNGQLDAKKEKKHSFEVTATDLGTPSMSSTASVEIFVIDRLSHPPIFSQNQYNATVNENVPVATPVIQVNATSGDGPVYYTAVLGNSVRTNNPRVFDVNVMTGQLSTSQSLDRELNDEYVVTIQAENNYKAKVYSTVIIYVADANDNRPEFPVVRYQYNVPENSPIGMTFGRTLAFDPDSNKNGLITYAIVDSSSKALFEIDSSDGWLRTKVVFDYENLAQTSFLLVVSATDGGSPAQSASALVKVKVIDVNDNPPQFNETSYTVTIREDATPGFRVLTGVTATDVDKHTVLSYTLSGNGRDVFAAVIDTGELQVQGKLDYETTPSYNLQLTVSDGLFKATVDIYVIIEDVNDITPKFGSEKYLVSILETAEVGSSLIQVNASDGDATPDIVKYSLQGSGQASKLLINATSGLVTTSGTLDREISEQNVLVLLAVDQVGHIGHSQLAITLIDVNDNRPIFEDSPYIVQIEENMPTGTTIDRFTADDQDKGDNQLITYSLISNPGLHFKIDPVSAMVQTQSVFDRETMSELTFTIEAVDHGVPRLTGQTNVTVNILDQNDNTPYFPSDYMLARVYEDAAIGWPVIQLSATDEDTGSNSQLVYTITSGNAESIFALEAETGVVRVVGKLNRHITASYQLTVEVCDSGFSPRQDSSTLVVELLDANDHSPQFSKLTYHVTIPENTLINSRILTINATDSDEGANGLISFSLNGVGLMCKFHLTSSGNLFVSDQLDYESVKLHNLTVVATDMGQRRQQTGTAKIQVFISDINDNEPVFERAVYSVNVKENGNALTSLLQVKASDRDSGSNGHITRYHIIKGNQDNMFSINSKTGNVGVASGLDREVVSKYLLTVVAVDGGQPSLTGSSVIVVTVLDDNDHPSQGGNRNIIVNALSNQLLAGVIGTVNAGDPDSSDLFQCDDIKSTSPGIVGIDRSNCDVVLLAANPPDGLAVNVIATANDHIHSDVTVSVSVHFRYIDNETLDHSLAIEINLTPKELINHGVNKLKTALSESFFDVVSDNVEIYSIQSSELRPHSASVIAFAVRQNGGSYMSENELLIGVSVNRLKIESSSGVAILSIPVDLCASEPCYNQAQCVNKVSITRELNHVDGVAVSFVGVLFDRDYVCNCEPGATGSHCETNIDDCFFSPCQNGGTCVDGLQGYTCICPSGASGTNCQDFGSYCDSQPCQNGGQCINVAFGYECQCPNAYYGDNCHLSVFSTHDSCSSSPCQNDGVCTAGPTGYTCSCPLGFTGSLCEQTTFLTLPCVSNPCLHGGKCSLAGDSFQCDCPEGFVGTTCSWSVNPCDLLPCQNGGTCYRGQFNLYACDCPSGITGQNCERKPRACQSNPCRNGGICTDGGMSSDYQCHCSVLYYGKNCQYAVDPPDYCSFFPCENGATCTAGRDMYTCTCPSGFTGNRCELIDSSSNLDPCTTNPCLHGSRCLSTSTTSFACQCSVGFFGNSCESEYNLCNTAPCFNGGICQPGINAFKCSCPEGVAGRFCEVLCPSGMTGPNCDKPIDYCDSMGLSYCQNGGTCESFGGKAICHCADGFYGEWCSHKLSCSSSPCKRHGTCTSLPSGGYNCSCLKGYEGPNCELTTTSFKLRSFRAFDSAFIEALGSIRLDFITVASHGLLVYNSQWQNGNAVDFMAVEVVDGQVEGVVNLGSGTERLVVSDVTVSDGRWHSVEFSHRGQEFVLSVDSCHTDSHICQTMDVTPGDKEYLNLGLPLYLGGIYQTRQDHSLSAIGFQGCMRNVYVNDQLLDMADFLMENGTTKECPETFSCQSAPCSNGGRCRETYFGFDCICPPGRTGTKCEKDAEAVTFSGSNYIQYSLNSRTRRGSNSNIQESYQQSFSFVIRPQAATGLLLQLSNSEKTEFTTLKLVPSGLMFSCDVGSGIVNVYVNITLIDDQYHHVLVSRVGKFVSVTVDETVTVSDMSPGTENTLQFDADSVYLGGSPENIGFSGCLKDPRYNESPLPLQDSTDTVSAYPVAGIGQGCNCPSLCGRDQCQEGKHCVQEAVGRCFSFLCVNFSCSLCAKGALCDAERHQCVCPPGYAGDQCNLVVGQSKDVDKESVEIWIIPAVIATLSLMVLIFVFMRRRVRQQRRELAPNEVAELSNPVNNVRFVTNRRFSDFQGVMSHRDEGGGEGTDNRYTAEALCSLGRYRHVSSRSDDSNLKMKVRLKDKSLGASSSSSLGENKQGQEEKPPEKVIATQSGSIAVQSNNIKRVQVPLNPPLENESSPDHIVAALEDNIVTTFIVDEMHEYCHEGDVNSYASGFSSICGHEHDNSQVDFEFLQRLGQKLKPVIDINADDKEEDEHTM